MCARHRVGMSRGTQWDHSHVHLLDISPDPAATHCVGTPAWLVSQTPVCEEGRQERPGMVQH